MIISLCQNSKKEMHACMQRRQTHYIKKREFSSSSILKSVNFLSFVDHVLFTKSYNKLTAPSEKKRKEFVAKTHRFE